MWKGRDLESKWSAIVVCFRSVARQCLFISSQPDLNAIDNGTAQVTEPEKCQPDESESVKSKPAFIPGVFANVFL